MTAGEYEGQSLPTRSAWCFIDDNHIMECEILPCAGELSSLMQIEDNILNTIQYYNQNLQRIFGFVYVMGACTLTYVKNWLKNIIRLLV